MKKSIRLISVLLAMVLCFSSFSVGVYAAKADITQPAGYDALDHPYISAYQVGTFLLDMIDEMLAEDPIQKHIKFGTIDINIDLSSVDNAVATVKGLRDNDTVKNLSGAAGDIDTINYREVNSIPRRTAEGRTDLEVLYGLLGFLKDNKTLIGKALDGELSLGGLVDTFWDVNDAIGDLHATIREALFDALFKDMIDDGVAVTSTKDSNIDAMVNEFIYKFVIDSDELLPSLKDALRARGLLSSSKSYAYNSFCINDITVYDLFRVAIDAALKDYAAPALMDAFYDEDDDELEDAVPIVIGLLEIDIEQGSMSNREYAEAIIDNLLDLENGGLSKFIDFNDNGIDLTDDFQTVLDSLLETATSFLDGLTSYDTVEKWSDEELATLTQQQQLAYFVRIAAISLIDYADIPITCLVPVTSFENNVEYVTIEEQPINGYGVATYFMINLMGDKMPERDYYSMISAAEAYKDQKMTAADYDALVEAGTILVPGQTPLLERNGSGTVVRYLEPAALEIVADYGYYYLNALTTMNIPEGLGFDEMFQWIINWAITNYGGVVKTTNLDTTTTPNMTNMVVWKNLDALLWDNILDITWLPKDYVASFKDANGNYTGNVTKTFLLDNLLYTVIDLDLTQLNNIFSVFHAYDKSVPGYTNYAELDQGVVSFLLTVVKRILNGMVQSDTALFTNTSINTLEDLISGTHVYDGKSNLRILAENLCTYLPDHAEAIIMSVLPLLGDSLGVDNDQYKANIADMPKNGETFTFEELRTMLDEQRPSNTLHDDMMTDDDYFFFGSEDFTPLYKYYNYKEARSDANDYLKEYDKDTLKIKAAKEEYGYDPIAGRLLDENNTDPETLRTTNQLTLNELAYKVGYYYNRLALRDPCVTALLREINYSKTNYGYGEYGSGTARGAKGYSEQFTLRTWTYYNDVINFAEKVYREWLLDSDTLRQSKISAARELMVLARKSLKFFSTEADYSELDRLITLAKGYLDENDADAGLFMADTIAVLRAAYEAGLAVDRGYDGDDQNIIDEATNILVEAIGGINYQPNLAKVSGSTTVLDKAQHIIYGVRERLSNYISYVQVLGVGLMEITNSQGGNGTGTTIALNVDGDILQSYTVVLFGDMDGDCRTDSQDANLVYMYNSGLVSNSFFSSYALLAADANNDGTIDELDAYALRQAGLLKLTINQRGAVA